MGWWIWIWMWMWMWMCVAGNVLKLDYNYYITGYYSCAKDANHSQIIGSPDPLFYLFTKAHRCLPWPAHLWRCVDFLLLGDADLEGLGGLVPMLKLVKDEDDAALHRL